MIRTSLQERSALGRAAETAARPPTRTKSSISVVTNNTLKKSPRTGAASDYARMVPVSHCVQWEGQAGRRRRVRTLVGRIPSLARPCNLGSRSAKVSGVGSFAMTVAVNDEGILTKSFQGLRVLDFSTTIAGPHCTRMLADMGAEVIKVESVEGETMRTRPPLRNGFSTVFGQLNVGKKSLVLDLKSPDAVDAVRRLVATTDILVENFRPGVMEIEAGLRRAARAQSEADLLLDLRIRSDRAVGGTSGLRTGHPCGLGLRYGAPVVSARAKPAGLLRHLSRRCTHRRLCVWRHLGGAVPAPRPSKRPAYRRFDAGIDAQPDAERSAVVAVRGHRAEPPDVWPGRDREWICDGRDRQRKDVPGSCDGFRPSGLDRRSALCGTPRPARQLERSDGRRRNLVAYRYHRAMSRRIE